MCNINIIPKDILIKTVIIFTIILQQKRNLQIDQIIQILFKTQNNIIKNKYIKSFVEPKQNQIK